MEAPKERHRRAFCEQCASFFWMIKLGTMQLRVNAESLMSADTSLSLAILQALDEL
jgi:hypothetical protein